MNITPEQLNQAFPHVYAQPGKIKIEEINFEELSKEDLLLIKEEIEQCLLFFQLKEEKRQQLRNEFKDEKIKLMEKIKEIENREMIKLNKKMEEKNKYELSDSSDEAPKKKQQAKRQYKKKN